MQQTAPVLVHCDPEKPLAEDLLNYIAEQRGYPFKFKVLAGAQQGPTDSDWKRFWKYTEAVDPYVRLRPEHVPLDKPRQLVVSSQLSLY